LRLHAPTVVSMVSRGFFSKKMLDVPLSKNAEALEVANWADTQALASGAASVGPYMSPRLPKLPKVQPMDEDDSPAALKRLSSLTRRFEALTFFLESPRYACSQEDSQLACNRGRSRVPRSFSLDMSDDDPAHSAAQSQQRASSLELRFAALGGSEIYAFAYGLIAAT